MKFRDCNHVRLVTHITVILDYYVKFDISGLLLTINHRKLAQGRLSYKGRRRDASEHQNSSAKADTRYCIYIASIARGNQILIISPVSDLLNQIRKRIQQIIATIITVKALQYIVYRKLYRAHGIINDDATRWRSRDMSCTI